MITRATRLSNFITDLAIILFFFTIIGTIFYETVGNYDGILFLVINFLYYFLSEFTWQQTLGKRLTKTKVVNLKGEKPSFMKVLLRTVWRFNPFDSLSYFMGSRNGSHDLMSGTKVVAKHNHTSFAHKIPQDLT